MIRNKNPRPEDLEFGGDEYGVSGRKVYLTLEEAQISRDKLDINNSNYDNLDKAINKCEKFAHSIENDCSGIYSVTSTINGETSSDFYANIDSANDWHSVS